MFASHSSGGGAGHSAPKKVPHHYSGLNLEPAGRAAPVPASHAVRGGYGKVRPSRPVRQSTVRRDALIDKRMAAIHGHLPKAVARFSLPQSHLAQLLQLMSQHTAAQSMAHPTYGQVQQPSQPGWFSLQSAQDAAGGLVPDMPDMNPWDAVQGQVPQMPWRQDYSMNRAVNRTQQQNGNGNNSIWSR